MAALTIVILIFIIPCVFTETRFSGNCSYSWCKYTGNIPEDAIPGGKDLKEEIFYVGLVHLKLINEVFAAMIIPSKQAARITSLGITRDVKNDPFTVVQILCSPDKEAFEWVAVQSENLHLLTNHNLVSGGKVLGQDLYIGRVRHNGGIALGKVFPHRFIYQGLYIPSGQTFAHYMSYKVLAFNCENKKVKAVQDSLDFDVRIGNSSESF